jgi:DNA-directed RNA polymerase subunit beta
MNEKKLLYTQRTKFQKEKQVNSMMRSLSIKAEKVFSPPGHPSGSALQEGLVLCKALGGCAQNQPLWWGFALTGQSPPLGPPLGRAEPAPKGMYRTPQPLDPGLGGQFQNSSLEKRDSAIFFSKTEKMQKSTKYNLQKYQRSNQDTLIFQHPLVREGDWIQAGDILADCSTSFGGELCLGKNIFIAYMPWEGYNYEDAILISQRLVTEDVYTSIHIESYEVETRSTKLGKEQITKKIPEIPENQLFHLDERGIVKRGTSVKEGDILVGKVTPVQKKFISAYEKLLYTILEKELIPMRDTSLRTPKGLKAKVLEVKIFNFSNENFSPPHIKKEGSTQNILQNPFFYKNKDTQIKNMFFEEFSSGKLKENTFLEGSLKAMKKNVHHFFFGEKNKIATPFKGVGSTAPHNPLVVRAEPSIPAGEKGGSPSAKHIQQKNFSFFVPSFSTNTKILKKKQHLFSFFFQNGEKSLGQKNQWQSNFENQKQTFSSFFSGEIPKTKKVQFFEKNYGKPEKVQVYLVEKRKIQVGDKMSGRHGNKGIVSQILPLPDMPFLPDGTPLDMVLNPLGVPSRMNVGQIYECILGLASKYLQQYYRIMPFDEIYGPQASRSFTFSKLYEARQKTSQKWLFNPCYPGKIQIFDGRTGESYENPVTVGISYILKLVHLVDDKIHARSTGPYSLVTQQPLKGRSKYGGQRLGEMEVWAIEAYGAAFVLLEMLTIKSDDISGRMTLWSNILLNMPIYIGTPESFKVLVCELQALCLDMGLYRLNKKGFLTQIEHLMQLP